MRRLRLSTARRAAPSRPAAIDPRRLARGPQRDRLRDADRRRRVAAGLLPRRACPARSSGRWRCPTRWRSLASLLVALTVTPALCLILLRDGAARAPRVAAGPRGSSAAIGAILPRMIRRPRRGRTSPVAAFAADRAGRRAAPRARRSCPSFKERDFLMHWVDEARHVAPGGCGGSSTRASKELRADPGRAQLRLAHRPGAARPTRSSASNFTENWISVDPNGRLRRDAGRDPGGRRRLPRPVPRRADLPERADQGGAHRRRASRSSSGSTAPTSTSCATRRRRSQDALADDRRRRPTAHVELQVDVPQIEVAVDLAAAQRYGLKPGDVRRAAATLVAGEEVGDIFRDGKAYDVIVWSTPKIARQPDRRSANLPIDTPPAAQVRLGDVADVGDRADAERDQARERLAADRRRAQRRGPRPRLRRARRRADGSTAIDVPARLPPRAARRVRRARRRPSSRLLLFGARRGARRSSCSCRPPSAAGG